ncbi:MAG: putative cyclase SCIF3 [Microbacteriaceae bacterium]|nr:putative cyclase SCIF3 [Microbacteriaceae bacterium]
MALSPETAVSDPYTREQVVAIAGRHNNWNRWGPDDERGASNLIDEAKVVRASALVKRGAVFTCGMPYNADGPQLPGNDRTNPVHLMIMSGGDIGTPVQDYPYGYGYTDDAVYMPLQSGTQWDAFSHIFFEGKMYNGYDKSEVTSRGAAKNSIDKLAGTMTSRGILVDIPRLLGIDWLQPGEGVSGAMIEQAVTQAGIVPEPGDILLVRTGSLAYAQAKGALTHMIGEAPGLAISAAEWLCERDFAAVAVDSWAMEVVPNQTPDLTNPLHVILNVNAGMLIGELFDFEALAEDCAADGVYECLFVAPPLRFTKSVGSPLNPIAIK